MREEGDPERRGHLATTSICPRQNWRMVSHHCRVANLGRVLSGSLGLRRRPASDTCSPPHIFSLTMPLHGRMGGARCA